MSGFDAGLFRRCDRTSNFTELPFRIQVQNQIAANPYQTGAVNSFGENRGKERAFGEKHQNGSQQLPTRGRAEPGVFGPARSGKETVEDRVVEEREQPGSNLLRDGIRCLTKRQYYARQLAAGCRDRPPGGRGDATTRQPIQEVDCRSSTFEKVRKHRILWPKYPCHARSPCRG